MARTRMPALVSVAGLLSLSAALAAPGSEREPDGDAKSRWARIKAPKSGPARSIGKYGSGCVQGAEALPLSGEGFQVMRPSRRRNFGHPVLLDFIRDLGRALSRRDRGTLLIGDLGQPRGGPAPSGHSSHQTGLDVDIWYWHPKKAERRRLSKRERERLSPRPIVSRRRKKPTRFYSRKVTEALRLAASDPRVARIFVNPLIKRELCRRAGKERAWLSKIRPWWGHDRHFHVRLECPDASPECVSQSPVPEGDGCDKLSWWLDEEARADRKKGQKSYQKRVDGRPELPARCDELAAE